MKKIQRLQKPIKYSITVPGSKSLLNRALVCAALANGRSIIRQPVYCDDTKYMIQALQHLGIKLKCTHQQIIVHGCGGQFPKTPRRIYIGNAGTVKRFLTPFVPAGTQLVGNARMQQRPIQQLLSALEQIKTNNHISITGQVSSQFISALLLYAPTLPHGLTITVTGKLVSAPYVQMTLAVMRHFGIKTKQHNGSFIIHKQPYHANNYTVEGDASSATYWWALAAITGSHITVPNIPTKTLQPDYGFLNVLQKMGCRVIGNTVVGPAYLRGITITMQAMPDAVPALAVVAAYAQGDTRVTGIAHLQHKESDRIHQIEKNIAILRSHNTTKKIDTAHDHRLAMAFTLAGLRQGNVVIDDPACVTKSYPRFWADVKKVEQQARRQTIVLTGMRGVGKTTLGKKLAKQYKSKFIDTDDYVTFQGDWKKFRDQEHRVVKKIYNKTNTVIATGGGTLMYPRNARLLNKHFIILMTAPISTLKKRLLKHSHRPALTKGNTVLGELSHIWKQRQPKYYQIADRIYDSR